MENITIRLKTIEIPYDEWLNPHSADMRARLDAFAASYKLYETIGLPRKVALPGHSLVNDYMFPRAAPGPLYFTGLMMVYFFLFDYVYDVDTVRQPKMIKLRDQLSVNIVHIIDGERPTGTTNFDLAAMDMFRMLKDKDSDWYRGMANELKTYILATLGGKVMGMDPANVTLDQYLDLRQRDSGGWWSAYLIEYAHDRYLTAAQRADATVREATSRCMFTCSLINDIFSFAKEKANEVHPFNAVEVIVENEGRTLADAYMRAIDTMQTNRQHFEDAAAKLEAQQDEALASYVQGLREFISGVWYWHQKCGLYEHPQSPFLELRTTH